MPELKQIVCHYRIRRGQNPIVGTDYFRDQLLVLIVTEHSGWFILESSNGLSIQSFGKIQINSIQSRTVKFDQSIYQESIILQEASYTPAIFFIGVDESVIYQAFLLDKFKN